MDIKMKALLEAKLKILLERHGPELLWMAAERMWEGPALVLVQALLKQEPGGLEAADKIASEVEEYQELIFSVAGDPGEAEDDEDEGEAAPTADEEF